MNKTVCILGRQPELGLAELESLFGADKLQAVGHEAVIVEVDPQDFPFSRLGGSIKAAKLLTRLDTTNWKKLSDYLVEHVPKHTCCIPEGKLTFGISTYGLNVNVKDIERTGLSVKKVHKSGEAKRSVRVVPNKAPALNSAQVLHNNMTKPLGMELLFVADGQGGVYLAQTFAVQDIEAYAARDQARPKRDAKVGMLPPKLAQIIVNLAVGDQDDIESIDREILDPFCGTGVILQEALLMGYSIQGTDLDPRMVDYATQNIHWLDEKHHVLSQNPKLESADATSTTWLPAPMAIAAETYLGRPFSSEPNPDVLHKVIQDVDTIHKKFLLNVASQTVTGFRMCIAVPAWKTKTGFRHLPTLDHLEELGYTRVSFKNAPNKDLIYHREGQFVGRELVVLIRK